MKEEEAELSLLAARLAAATEELNEELCRAEFRLQGLDLGVSAEVPLFPSNNEVTLCFGKMGDEWRLFVRRPSTDPVHLIKCSRAYRVQATERLDDLLDAVVSTNRAHFDSVKAALERVKAFNEKIASADVRGP